MVSVKKGDLIRMEFTGRIASTGQIFDTTDESVAKSAGIFEQNSIYGPKLAVFGNGSMVRGIEEAVASCPQGKTEEFMISPENGFGKRLPELIRMLPEKQFAKQGISPSPGLMLNLDGTMARVKSVTSGRVVVDFNHPLAGESVVYSVKVHEVITDGKKKIEAISASVGLSPSISENGGKISVSFKKSDPPEKVEMAKRAISSAAPEAEIRIL